MKTFAEHLAYLKQRVGHDVGAACDGFYPFRKGEEWPRHMGRGGRIGPGVKHDPLLEMGPGTSAYGPLTHLSGKTVLKGLAVIGAGVLTEETNYIGDSAYVTGEKPGHPFPYQPESPHAQCRLQDCHITGQHTFVSRCFLFRVTVADGAWMFETNMGEGSVSGMGTIVSGCKIGYPPSPESVAMGEYTAMPFDGIPPVHIRNGAQLIDCTILPGVQIDKPIRLVGKEIRESDPSITSKETLIRMGLAEKFGLNPSPINEVNFGSRRHSGGKESKSTHKDKEHDTCHPYIM